MIPPAPPSSTMRRRAGEVERKLEGAGWPKLIVMLYYFTTAILFTKSQTIKEKKHAIHILQDC